MTQTQTTAVPAQQAQPHWLHWQQEILDLSYALACRLPSAIDHTQLEKDLAAAREMFKASRFLAMVGGDREAALQIFQGETMH